MSSVWSACASAQTTGPRPSLRASQVRDARGRPHCGLPDAGNGEVLRTAVDRLRHPQPPQITQPDVRCPDRDAGDKPDRRDLRAAKGTRASSEVLVADSTHTKSDVFTSLTVIAALAGMAAGIPFLDPIAAFIVVGFIGRAGVEMPCLRRTSWPITS